jgi:hypothetical protein
LNDLLNESVPPICILFKKFQKTDECAVIRRGYRHQNFWVFLYGRGLAVEEIDARQVLEALHLLERLQQGGPPQANFIIELEADALKKTSRDSEHSEDPNPPCFARFESPSEGVLIMYLESDISKVGSIPPADAIEPCMCISGALGCLVNLDLLRTISRIYWRLGKLCTKTKEHNSKH